VKKLVLPENKSVNDFREMEEEAMEPGPDPGGVGAPPVCFGAAVAAAAPPTGIFGGAADDLRRILLLRFFLDIYRNNTNTNTNTIITIDYLSRATLRYVMN
jgi:hypothetical protein